MSADLPPNYDPVRSVTVFSDTEGDFVITDLWLAEMGITVEDLLNDDAR